jgi:hypothetical protein
MIRFHWKVLLKVIRTRFALLRQAPEAGYVSEWVLLTALLISTVLVVAGIFAAKIIATANGIEL